MIDASLLRVLSGFAGSPQTYADSPTPITGGFWAAIYGFELRDPPPDLRGPLVLRVMPNPDAGVRETIVQRGVVDQGYRAPRVVLDGVDDSLGGAFLVMERVGGAPAAGRPRDRWGRCFACRRRFAGSPGCLQRQRCSCMPSMRNRSPMHCNPPESTSARWESRHASPRSAKRLRSPASGFAALLTWLEARRPVMTPAVVCHGDIHPFNMLVTDDDAFNVLDWTNANLCRREYDVGFTAALLRCAPIAVPRFAEPVLSAVTGALSRRFVDAYRRSVPVNLEVVDWFEVLQYGRCLAAVATSPIDDPIIGTRHPFRLAARAMIRQLQIITDVTIELPRR